MSLNMDWWTHFAWQRSKMIVLRHYYRPISSDVMWLSTHNYIDWAALGDNPSVINNQSINGVCAIIESTTGHHAIGIFFFDIVHGGHIRSYKYAHKAKAPNSFNKAHCRIDKLQIDFTQIALFSRWQNAMTYQYKTNRDMKLYSGVEDAVMGCRFRL